MITVGWNFGQVGHIVSTALNALPLDRAVFADVTPSEVKVSPRQASNLALIINELVTNTTKYAVSRHVATHVAIRIALEDDEIVLLEYRDDGTGYPEDVLCLEQHGIGLYLIQILVRHALNGSLALFNDDGAVTTVRFKAKEEGTT